MQFLYGTELSIAFENAAVRLRLRRRPFFISYGDAFGVSQKVGFTVENSAAHISLLLASVARPLSAVPSPLLESPSTSRFSPDAENGRCFLIALALCVLSGRTRAGCGRLSFSCHWTGRPPIARRVQSVFQFARRIARGGGASSCGATTIACGWGRVLANSTICLSSCGLSGRGYSSFSASQNSIRVPLFRFKDYQL